MIFKISYFIKFSDGLNKVFWSYLYNFVLFFSTFNRKVL